MSIYMSLMYYLTMTHWESHRPVVCEHTFPESPWAHTCHRTPGLRPSQVSPRLWSLWSDVGSPPKVLHCSPLTAHTRLRRDNTWLKKYSGDLDTVSKTIPLQEDDARRTSENTPKYRNLHQLDYVAMSNLLWWQMFLCMKNNTSFIILFISNNICALH